MSQQHSRLRRSVARLGIVVLILVLGAGGLLVTQYFRPLPALTAQPELAAQRALGTAPRLPWPRQGSAALWMDGYGLLAAQGDPAPRPIASTTKMMTALLVLEDHPLAPGQPGPTVTITAQDVSDYQQDAGQDQSVVPVTAGEQLSELQLLQALLLPSANNIAEVLAQWDAGSREAFVAKMNARASALGMAHTHYADASGFSPQTVSTPADLLTLGVTAMGDPVFRQTVALTEATLPVAGVVYNVNADLGKEGNIGIKTGSTDEAGGCFVSATIEPVGGAPRVVYAAVLGQERLDEALSATRALSRAAAASFRQTQILGRTDIVGTLTTAWGTAVALVPREEVAMLAWPGMTLKARLQLDPVHAPLPAGSKVGTLTLELGEQTQQVEVVTTAPLDPPSWQWRATRFLRGQ